MNTLFSFRQFLSTSLVAVLCLLVGCMPTQSEQADSKDLVIEVTNPSSFERSELVRLDITGKGLSVQKGIMDDQLVELVDQDGDALAEELLIGLSINANEKKVFNISKSIMSLAPDYIKKQQSEISIKTGGAWNDRKYEGGTYINLNSLSVPPQHTDHSYFIRYEGPGLENEMIGYRFYLDWRNAVDIFGKKVDTLVLHTIGLDNFDSYHEMSDWGMDVLKAGKSLGVGSVGQFIDGKVEHFKNTDSVRCTIENECLVLSSVSTDYYGWQTSKSKSWLRSTYSIRSGDRSLYHEVEFNQPLEDFCTGIVKHEKAQRLESLVESNGWAYIATYGPQSLADDNLGLAILFNTKDVERIVDSEFDHLIIFKPSRKTSYYLLGAWEREKNGIRSMEEFLEYLDQKIERLNNPVLVNLL